MSKHCNDYNSQNSDNQEGDHDSSDWQNELDPTLNTNRKHLPQPE